MFEQFRKNFSRDRARSDDADATVPLNVDVSGWNEFFSEFSGCSFNDGLYRIFGSKSMEKWNEIVSSSFSIPSDSLACFGYDWLGRVFALDFDRSEAGEPLILMFEPGTGDALEVPASFVEFHEVELKVHKTECLEPEYYDEWLSSGNEPLPHDRCAGYKVPLFLGGEDAVGNLELSDMEVYWVVLGQVLQQIQGKS